MYFVLVVAEVVGIEDTHTLLVVLYIHLLQEEAAEVEDIHQLN